MATEQYHNTLTFAQPSLQDRLSENRKVAKQHIYPSDLFEGGDGSGHYIMFTVYESKPWLEFTKQSKLIEADLGSGEFRAAGNKFISLSKSALEKPDQKTSQERALDHIILYMPGDITASYGLTWEGESPGDFANILNDIVSQLDDKGAVGAITSAFAGAAIKRFILQKSTTLSAKARTAVNPNMLFLFRQPTERTFEFTFKFIPRNRQEQENVQRIIKTFKMHAHPTKPGAGDVGTDSNLLWTYPNTFGIQFFSNGVENTWLHKIYNCALTNISVDNTASGTGWTAHPVHYGAESAGAPPTHIDLKLSFKELAILEREDIEKGY